MKQTFKILSLVTFCILTILGCANRGSGPQGGPKDTTPPKLLKCTPENGATNISSNKIQLTFDEIVLVQSTFEKVVISPPQTSMAIIKASGHKVNVELQDSLKEKTTYTIDFTTSIIDNNERNELDGFTFSFATGDFIDTLKLSGTIVDSETLNPIPNIIVGIHSNLNDTAFVSIPFDRITKTNDEGKFTISNIREGGYHVFALSDVGNNYFFDIPTEQIAFDDSVYTPICTTEITYDTISHYAIIDSVNNIVDSIRKLKDAGLWVIGTDGDADTLYYNQDLKGPLAIIVGSEGFGMSKLVKENADILIKIPMKGNITSLNASVSAGIVIYEAVKQRG
jgi:hypothetical protein